MENMVLEDIKRFAVARLKEVYGYCGVADGLQVAMINSNDRAGHDIEITIRSKRAE